MNNYVPPEFQAASLDADSLSRAEFDHGFPEQPGRVYLLGPTGTGKTHYAFALIRKWLNPPHWPMLSMASLSIGWLSVPQAIAEARSAVNFKAGFTESDLLDEWRAPRVLLLDDLSMPDSDQRAWQVVFNLIDYRWSHRLPTIVTSNVKPSAFEPRLSDRFQDFKLGVMKGKSMRGRL